MARGRVGKLEVEVTADLDKLDKGLRDAEHKTRQTGANIERASNANGRAFSGVVEEGAKALVVMGAVELAIKVATAASEAFAGNWEKAGEVIKQMPAGIGPVAQAIEGMVGTVGELTGLWESVAQINERIDEAQVKILANAKRIAAARQLNAQAQDLKDQLAIADAQAGHERIMLELQIKRRIEFEKIDKLRRQAGAAITAARAEELKALALKKLQVEAEQKLLRFAEQQKAQNQAPASSQSFGQAAAGQDNSRLESFRAFQRVSSNVKQLQMQLQGDQFGAQREALQQAFREATRDEGSEAIKMLLQKQLEAQLELVDKAEADAQAAETDSLARAFATTGFQQVSASRFGTASTTGPVELTEDKKQTQILTRIERNTGRNNTAVLAP